MKILVLNSGSSSQKSSLYDIGGALPDLPPEPVWAGKMEWNGEHAELDVRNCERREAEGAEAGRVAREMPRFACSTRLCSGKTRVVAAPSEIDVVGHRMVNGGNEFTAADRRSRRR